MKEDEIYKKDPRCAPPGWEPLLPELEEDPKTPDLPNIIRELEEDPIRVLGDKVAAEENKVGPIIIKAVKLTYIFFPGYVPSQCLHQCMGWNS